MSSQSSLRSQLNAPDAAGVARRPPTEYEVELDKFIAENSQLRERYNAMTKEELIRKLMGGKMARVGVAELRNREMKPWVDAHPEIKAKIEERLKNILGQKPQRVTVNLARSAAAAQGTRAPRLGI